MADEQETQVDPQVEQEARALGWVPDTEFRGDKAKWVDADTFVKRGKEQLPILLENNKRLKGEVASLRGKVGQLENLFEGSQESIAELKKFHEDTFNERIKAERIRIKKEIVAARKEDDVDAEFAARDQLEELDAEVRKVDTTPTKKPEPKAKAEPTQAAESPAFIAWRSANPWFISDPRKAGMAFGLANQIRQENPDIVDAEFFKLLDEAIDEQMPSVRPAKVNKVDAPRGGSSGGGGIKGYNALPPDAKATCDRQTRQFVGTNKAFKTEKEWQEHYSKVYFDKDAE